MTIIGIDPSLTGTAVAWIAPGELITVRNSMRCQRFTSEASGQNLYARFARFRTMRNQIVALCNEIGATRVILEGYSMGSKGRGLTDLCEFGGLLRDALMQRFNVFEVSPSSLKKFATGVGNADKMKMAVAVAKRWDLEYKTSDEIDAAVACLLGHAEAVTDGAPSLKPYAFTQDQLRVATDALTVKPPKSPKPKAKA